MSAAEEFPRFTRLAWDSDPATDPVVIYYEIDSDRWEVRKVDEFADGTLQWADATHSDGSTWLATENRLPPLSEINAQPVFAAAAISAAEFERLWRAAQAQPDSGK